MRAAAQGNQELLFRVSAPPFCSISVIHLCLNGPVLSELLSTDSSWAGGDVRSRDPGSYVNHQQRLACGPLISLLPQTPGPGCSDHQTLKLNCISSLPQSLKIPYFNIFYEITNSIQTGNRRALRGSWSSLKDLSKHLIFKPTFYVSPVRDRAEKPTLQPSIWPFLIEKLP